MLADCLHMASKSMPKAILSMKVNTFENCLKRAANSFQSTVSYFVCIAASRH